MSSSSSVKEEPITVINKKSFCKVINPCIYSDPIVNGVNVIYPMAQAISIKSDADFHKTTYLIEYSNRFSNNKFN